jgi:hypothetical protein
MDPKRTSPRTKPLPKSAPYKKGSGSRKTSKLTNKNAGRGEQQWMKRKRDAPISLENSSHNASSDSNLDYYVPKAEAYESKHDSYNELNNKSRAQLLKMLQERDRRRIMALEMELAETKRKQRENKKQIQENYKWTGEEANFADTVNQFCKRFFFPRYNFLKEGWQDFQPEKKNSLFSFVKQNLSIPEETNNRDIWDRVIVPSIRMKYINTKWNLNNKIKGIYMSMRFVLVYLLCYFIFTNTTIHSSCHIIPR